MPAPLKLFLAIALTAGSLTAQASLAAQQLTTRCDAPPGSLGRLTRTQKKVFMAAEGSHVAQACPN